MPQKQKTGSLPHESQMKEEFTRDEWEVVRSVMEEISLKKGELLFEEGSHADEVYFLIKGSLEIIKKGHRLAIFGPGNWVGEVAALRGNKIRTASVRARENSRLIKLSLADLKEATKHRPEIHMKTITSLSKGMAQRLHLTSEATVASMQKKLELANIRFSMGQFMLYVLMALAFFFYILKIISVLKLSPQESSIVSIPLILFLGIFLYLIIKKSRFPLSVYGLTWRNSKKAIIECLIATVPLIALFILSKWFIVSVFPSFKETPLFRIHGLLQQHLGAFNWILMTFGYTLLVPIQELMVRGCLQGSFEKFFVGKGKLFMAIILSNLIFSTLHLQLSLEFAIYVFLVGCYWGWLYSRHRTLIGVSLSHIIFGNFGFYILGPLFPLQ